MKLTLTYWEREQIHLLLGSQPAGQAPLSVVSDLLKARDKVDVSDIEEDDLDAEYEIELNDQQLKHIYRLATNENINWPINERSEAFFDKINEATQ